MDTFILPIFLIFAFFWWKFGQDFFKLYKKKENPNFFMPDPNEVVNYVNNLSFQERFLMPFGLWKILFQKHKDKEVNNAANKVRLIFFLFIGWTILMMIIYPLFIWK